MALKSTLGRLEDASPGVEADFCMLELVMVQCWSSVQEDRGRNEQYNRQRCRGTTDVLGPRTWDVEQGGPPRTGR